MNLVPVKRNPAILQVLPALISGGVERGTVDMALYIASQGWGSFVASAGGGMEREFARTNVRHITLPLNSKNPLTILRNARKLRRIAAELQIDIMHARSRAPAWAAFRALRKLPGCRLVTSFHGRYNFKGKAKHWYNSVMTRGERVIAVSHFIAGHIVRNYGIDASRIDVVPRGIDLVRFDPEKIHRDRMIKLAGEWRLPDDKPIILLPGRLTRWKGQAELLDALAKLPGQNFFCLFLGSDHGHESYRKTLEDKVRALGLDGKVKWAGECRDMPAAYMLADVVISNSLEPEAFGRVVVEAQAMGRPVIATDHGGSSETIIDGQTGFLVPHGDSAALSRMIAHVLSLNAQARERFAAAATAHVRAHYSRDQMCAGEFAVYQKVLAESTSLTAHAA